MTDPTIDWYIWATVGVILSTNSASVARVPEVANVEAQKGREQNEVSLSEVIQQRYDLVSRLLGEHCVARFFEVGETRSMRVMVHEVGPVFFRSLCRDEQFFIFISILTASDGLDRALSV